MPESKSLSQAVESLHCNELAEAERICANVLHDEPRNAKAWHLRGIANAMGGALDKAVECFQHAIGLDANHADYHYNLGLAFKGLGQPDLAVESYREAISRNEDFLQARNNLGNVLLEQGAIGEAIECFRELIDQFPDSSDGHYNLGNLLRDAGRLEDGIEHYRRAVELDPANASARENLGRALTDQGRMEEARAVWQDWLECQPESAVAQHMLASAAGENVPQRCDDQYVRETFDEVFAQSFDRQLAQLEYQAPALVIEAVKSIDPEMGHLDVLDAGCGTGLCGPLIRSLARRLVGVDLSEDMLVEARKRATYDETIAGELTEYMKSQPASFDLIISADTLCYFGELGPVLAAACGCLRDDGVLVFTIELDAAPITGRPYQLQQHGRYCHTVDYVQQTLRAAGFSILAVTHEALRKQLGRPVNGLVVTATKNR